ncbi:unnamed protein product [Adineta steineri]|uniref:BZIP domain-containing protein n=1 Tax=Adineta steineri TaxID=433720 RepID=A0A814N0S2_9BILA|nr:unnamed protein product [Adineta steineri]
MGKRGRKPMKSDTNTRLEKSRESARQCRHRKKLRYEYLEELVSDREKAIVQLQQELERLRSICKQIDQHEELVSDREKAIVQLQQELERLRSICKQIDQHGMTNEIHQELIQWKNDPDITNLNH